MKRFLCISFGLIFLILGVIGLLLPILPTTPFILASFACFSTTPRLRLRIMKIPFLKEYIVNYESRSGLSKKIVIISLSWLWGMMFLSIALIKVSWISFILVLIGVAVTIHILWIARAKRKTGVSTLL